MALEKRFLAEKWMYVDFGRRLATYYVSSGIVDANFYGLI